MITRVLTMILAVTIVCSSLTAQNLLNKPESIAFDKLNDRYLVANAEDGKIVAVAKDGTQTNPFSTASNALGNVIADDVLYVSNWPVSQIYSFDLTADTLIQTYTVTGVTAIDGLTTDTSGNLYVIGTYTGGSNLIQFNLADGTETTVVAGLPGGGQDLIFDKVNNRIFSVYYYASSPIIAINLDDFTTEVVVPSTAGFIDGITIDDEGSVYISAAQEDNIFKYESSFTDPPELIATVGDWPCGIDYNFDEDLIAVPLFDSNEMKFVYFNYKSECDTAFGQVPLDVNFTGSSDLEVASWHWDFGDGNTSSEQSPSHTYTTAGIYDATMNIITTSDDTLSRTIYNISVLADTLKSDTIYGTANEQIEVPIRANNTVPIHTFDIPFEYKGNLLLKFDSVSTVGCRTDYFEVLTFSHYDAFNKKITAKLKTSNGGAVPALPPGEGDILKIYFTLHSTASPGKTNPILLDGYSTTYDSYTPLFYGNSFNYNPQSLNTVVTVPIPACCQADRGNVNSDELDQFDISDIVFFVDFMFNDGEEPSCPEEADVVPDESIDISDLVFMVDYMFNEGDPPPACI